MTRLPATEDRPGYFVPLVSVRGTFVGVPRDFTALADSGADYTMLPASLLQAYGVDLTTLKQTGWSIGASGAKVPRFDFAVDLTYRGRKFASKVGVLGGLPRPLLGRDDFMRAFGIHFHWEVDPPAWCVRKVRNPRP